MDQLGRVLVLMPVNHGDSGPKSQSSLLCWCEGTKSNTYVAEVVMLKFLYQLRGCPGVV